MTKARDRMNEWMGVAKATHRGTMNALCCTVEDNIRDGAGLMAPSNREAPPRGSDSSIWVVDPIKY